MESPKEFEKKLELLRGQALERMARSQEELFKGWDEETRRILYELNVHQIELELQNEELREAQQHLENSRNQYLQLFHQAPVGYIAVDPAGMILQANQTFGRMIDKDINALLHTPLSDMIHPEDRPVFFARFRSFYKNPSDKQFDIRLLKNSGATVHMKLEGRRIDPSDRPEAQHKLSDTLLISLSDITLTKAAERAIERAKKQWEQTFDAVADPIAIIDHKYDIIRVNNALAQRVGTIPQECVGRKCYQVLHASNRPSDDCPHSRFTRLRMAVRSEGFDPILKGYFIKTIIPFHSDLQEAHAWSLHVYHDISDRKKMEDELLKLRNLESIGKLAGGIAHDYNNILTALMGHIELAKLSLDRNSSTFEHLEKSTQACEHAKDLTNRLITFSGGGSPRRHPIRIHRVIEEIAESSFNGTKFKCVLELAENLHPLIIDEAQIRSALQNIITNACEAMHDGGIVTIAASNTEVAPPGADPADGLSYIKIDIIDQGNGIAPSDLEKIFDPYFTTKQMGYQKGMGLGLSITHSIIKQHKGHIEVQSKQGEGTKITVFLPISQGLGSDPFSGS